MIPAIVLAAGRSSRMGRAKATLPLDGGDSFLTRIVRTFLEAGVDDVIVVDVPLVSASTVRAVVEQYRRTHAPVVRPTSGTRHGHPLLIDRSLFAALRAADPSAGAKPLVRTHASPAGDLAVADEGAFTDIDTEGDYLKTMTDRSR